MPVCLHAELQTRSSSICGYSTKGKVGEKKRTKPLLNYREKKKNHVQQRMQYINYHLVEYIASLYYLLIKYMLVR